MSTSSVFSEDPPILYELLVYEEWVQDPEPQKCRPPMVTANPPKALSPYRLINYLRQPYWPCEELANSLHSQLSWKIALSPCGWMAAILQDGFLEVRSHEDDFTSVIGKAVVPKDEFPQLRLLKWHPKNTKIAVSSSTGQITIFDNFCNHLYSLPEPFVDDICRPQPVFVAGIEFLSDHENNLNGDHLIVVYSNGVFKGFALNEREPFEEMYETQLGVNKVSCAIYNSRLNLLYLAAEPEPSTAVFKDTCFSAGLSAWRFISEEPYCVMVFPSDEELKMYKRGGILNKPWLMGMMFNRLAPSQGVAVKLCVSQSNQYLASLHSCNTIIIWHLPSLRLYRKWSDDYAEEISNSSQDSSQSSSSKSTYTDKAPVDIEWRHDEKLIISRNDGSISVHHVDTFETSYVSGSDLLSGHPRISSSVNFPGFIALECDTVLLTPSSEGAEEEADEKSILDTSAQMIQNTLYYITDIDTFQPKKKASKMVQKIYRLIGVRSTTPEELFWRKLEIFEYEGALELAIEYGLNTDEVYKKLWRTALVSAISIKDYLSKIKNISWVLNECIQRVPESVAGAEDLYNFGLELTSLSCVSGEIPSDDLTPESLNLDELTQLQEEKLATRAVLVNYGDKLRAYSIILGGNPDLDGTFDMAQHDRFRKLPIVESAVYFARQCQIQAVEVIFKYYTFAITPFWLNILDNIPEILSPIHYEKLLPQCDEAGRFIPWQDVFITKRDWIQSPLFENIVPSSMEEISLKGLEPVLGYNSNILTQWYRKRVCDIELRSKLVQLPLKFIEMAIDRNIKGLEELHAHMVTLDAMVYELRLDIDLSTLLNMTDLQKCIKLMEGTNPVDFLDKMEMYFFPFIARHKIEDQKLYELYIDFLTYTSKDNLESVLSFIRDILGANTGIGEGPLEMVILLTECVYTHESFEVLLETLETIDACKSWIKSLPDMCTRTQSLELLYELRHECSAAFIFDKYRIPSSLKAIHDVKEIEIEAKKVIKTLTTCAIRQYRIQRSTAIFDDCLRDVLVLQELVFNCISIDDCYEIYASALLGSNCLPLIEASSAVLCCKKEDEVNSNLSFEKSRSLVLQAARKYFDSSENVDDVNMDLAKACLFLIKDNIPEISRELDLIQGLRYLNEVGVNLIPIQVRLSEDRMKLLNLCFDKNPKLYKKPQFVYKLAAKLGTCGDNILHRHNVITKKLADVALNDGAVALCVDFCTDLVANAYEDGWEVIYRLLSTKSIEEHAARKLLWCFCSAHAPSRLLSELFVLRNSWDIPSLAAYEGSGTASLVATPDSEMEDYHLASSDSSHKLDEPSDAEPIPCYASPCFYSDVSDSQGDQFAEYRITTKVSRWKHPFANVLSLTSDESLLPFIEARKFRVDPWIVDSRLIELSRKALNKDTLTALGHLLNTSNPLSCEDFFDKLPQVPFTNELAVYYYAYCSLRESMTLRSSAPNQIVQGACALPNAEFMSSITKYSRKLESVCQAKSLKEEDCGVDYERFVDDESYKTDTIFGLAMSPKTLGIALDLASKNRIPLDEIATAYLNVLFLENKMDEFLKSQTDNSELTSILKSNSRLIIERFQKHYDNIDGSDYKKMSNFFKVINAIDENHLIEELVPKEHLKLLKRIESIVPGLDYHKLFNPECSPLSLFKPFLQQSDTVANCVKLYKSLPKSLKGELTASRLYFEFCLHQFYTLCLDCQSLKQCSSNFETIFPTLAKLNVNDLLELVQSTICCDEVVKKLDHIYRRQLLVSLLKWCHDRESRAELTALVLFARGKLEILDAVWSDEIEEMMPNPTLSEYLCEIELHNVCEDNKHEKLIAIVEKALHDPALSTEERRQIKLTASSLIPSRDRNNIPLLSETFRATPTPSESDSSENVAPEEENKLVQIKQFCDYFLSKLRNEIEIEPREQEIVGSGISRSMLDYLFSPDTMTEKIPSDDKFFTRYEVAETVILADLPPSADLRFRILEAFETEHCDRVFLAWLCYKCSALSLQERGSSVFLTLQVDQIADYLNGHIYDSKRIAWVLVATKKYPMLASYFLGEANMMMLQIFVEALTERGMLVEAGMLDMFAKRVPGSLRTFGSSFR